MLDFLEVLAQSIGSCYLFIEIINVLTTPIPEYPRVKP